MQSQVIREKSARWRRWTVAAACFGAAFALRMALHPWLGDRAPFLTFASAAIIAAWFGGLWPGLAVALAGAVAADRFILPPEQGPVQGSQ